MTIVVGVLCEDGVVVASDSEATLAAGMHFTAAEQGVQKVYEIPGVGVFASSGAIGMSQLFNDCLGRKLRDENTLRHVKSVPHAMHEISKALAEVHQPHVEAAQRIAPLDDSREARMGVIIRCLVAVLVKGVPQLIQLGSGLAPEHATPQLPLISIGSGQPLADPFLKFLRRTLLADRKLGVAEGRLLATWAVRYAVGTGAHNVGGDVQIKTLRVGGDGKAQIETGDPRENTEHILAAEIVFRDSVWWSPPAGAPVAPCEPPPAPPPPAPPAAPAKG